MSTSGPRRTADGYVHTISGSKPLTRAEMADGKRLTLSRRSRKTRPQTRGECAGGARPCPWVSCRYHLYLDVKPSSGTLQLNFPDREVDEMTESCALDVADRGGVTLEEIGKLFGPRRARARAPERGRGPAAQPAAPPEVGSRSTLHAVSGTTGRRPPGVPKLPQPFATMFALGALAGLRPGEVLAIEWPDIDLPAQRLRVQRQVRHGKVGPPKSGKPRIVPITGLLSKVLAEWKLATGGEGQLFRPAQPLRGGTKKPPPRYLNLHTFHAKLRDALKEGGLPVTLTAYECTRHTYAAHFVMGGGSLAQLREILGHSTMLVTERYGHLRPELVRVADLPTMDIDLSRAGAAVIDLAAARRESSAVGCGMGADDIDETARNSVSTDAT